VRWKASLGLTAGVAACLVALLLVSPFVGTRPLFSLPPLGPQPEPAQLGNSHLTIVPDSNAAGPGAAGMARPWVLPSNATVLGTVDITKTGPTIDPRIYSFNVAAWTDVDYDPPNPAFVAMLRLLHPALLRFPAGHASQDYYFDPTNTRARNEPPAGYGWVLTGAELDDFLNFSHEVGAQPLIGINQKTGTPQMAAEMVWYLNVEHQDHVHWFEIGNEPDLHGTANTTPQSAAYSYLQIARAMRSADPSIGLVGGVFMTGADLVGIKPDSDWLTPYSSIVGGEADAYSWHLYPLDSDNPASRSASPSVPHLLQETAPDWPPSGLSFVETACARMDAVRNATGAEHWVTELGPDSGARQAPGITNGQVAAVWAADVLPRLTECGAKAIFQFALHQQAGSDLVLLTEDFQPTPMWATWQYMSADYRGVVVASHSNDSVVEIHAARQPDGAVTVLLTNKGPAAESVAIDVHGMPQEGANLWTIAAPYPTDTSTFVNGVPFDRTAALNGVPPTVAPAGRAVEVPPYSTVVAVYAAR
jgi:hypothetical protein